MNPLLLLGLLFLSTVATAGDVEPFFVRAEAGPTWIARNDARIPGAGGTRISLNDLTGTGPVLSGRIEWGRLVHRHGWRALVAPFRVRGTGTLKQSTVFGGAVFPPGVPTDALYRFDSYRLSYVYRFFDSPRGDGRIGFTAKIRDAEISLTQNGITSRKSNTGVVPLAYFRFARDWGSGWSAAFDLDGSAAPQGRAIDAGLKILKQWSARWRTSLSLRTLEGGADNDAVYTFGWTHSLFLGLEFRG